MKRLSIFLMMFLYVVSVSGVTVIRHFCGGKLTSVTLSLLADDHTCSCGSKKMKKDCCKNQHVQVKVKGEHKIIGKLAPSKESYQIIPFQKPEYKRSSVVTAELCFSNYDRPPPRPNNSLLVFHCVFRI